MMILMEQLDGQPYLLQQSHAPSEESSDLLLDDPDDPLAVETLLQTFEERYVGYKMLAIHYLWEDLFWRRKHERVEWLERLIRL